MTKDEALNKIATVNAMDYEYQAWAREALAQPPLPVQPAADEKTVALVKQCRDAFAEEISAYDIEPPIHHLKQGHADCVAWLAAHNIEAKP